VIKPFVSSNQTIVLCAGESYNIGNSTYNTTGNYSNIFQAVDGCDSTVFTDLTILEANETTQNITVCAGESYSVGTETYTASGTYETIFTAANGCDSTVTTNLTVLNEITNTQNVSICFSTSYTIGTSIYTQAGTYIDTLVSAFGCDSIVTTNLTIKAPINVATTTNELTITATATNATYQWINCANSQIIAGAASQTFTATANGQYAVIVTQNGCSDTSACVTIDNVILDEMDATSVTVYPNPATENVSISCGSCALSTITVYNAMGQKILSKEVNGSITTLDISDFARCIYHLQIETTNQTITKRITKQ
jgi:hypothetical protein